MRNYSLRDREHALYRIVSEMNTMSWEFGHSDQHGIANHVRRNIVRALKAADKWRVTKAPSSRDWFPDAPKGALEKNYSVIISIHEHDDAWELTFHDGWSLNCPKSSVVPQVGSIATCYGEGLGFPVHALDIDFVEMFDNTPEGK